MAIQTLIPGYNPGTDLGQALGTGIENSLSGLMQGLAHSKIQQLHQLQQKQQQQQQAQQFQSLQSILGQLSPEQANALAGLPEPIQKQFIDQLIQLQQGQELQRAQGFGQQQQPQMQQQFGQQQQEFPQGLELLQLMNGLGQQQQAQPQPQVQQQQEAPRLTAHNVEKGLKERKDTGEAQSIRNQTVIDRGNTNWLKGQTKAYENAQMSESILNEMEELINTGKVASGIKGKLPLVLQNDETQLFDKLSNQLAGILAGNQGVATGFKIRFAQTQKPNINQNPGTQKKLIEQLKKEVQRPLKINEIKDRLIAENDYKQPANLETKVNQLYKQAEHKTKNENKRDFESLPSAKSYNGKRIKDEKTGAVYKSNGSKWVKES